MNVQDTNAFASDITNWIMESSGKLSLKARNAYLNLVNKEVVDPDGPSYRKFRSHGWDSKLAEKCFENLCWAAEEYSKKTGTPMPDSVKFRLTMMKI